MTKKETASKKHKVRKTVTDADDMLARPEYSLSEGIRRYMPEDLKNKTGGFESNDYLKAAESALHNRDDLSAINLASQSLKLDPENANAYYARGRALVSGGDDRKAIEDLQTAIKLNPRLSGAWHALGRAYGAQREWSKAIDAITRSIELNPADQACFKTRATLYVQAGEREKAIKDYTTAVTMTPNDIELFFVRGQVYETLNKTDEALKDYERCINEDAGGRKVPYKILCSKREAEIYSVRGEHKKSMEALSRAIKIDGNDEELYRMRGQRFAKLGENQKAIDDYTRAIEMAPDFAGRSYEARSKLYAAMGEKEAADKDAREAARLLDAPAEKPVY